MRLDLRLAQPLQQPHAVDRARRARDADDQAHSLELPYSQSPNAQLLPLPNVPTERPDVDAAHFALGIGRWELPKAIIESRVQAKDRTDPCSARRAACSSASTTTPATTAAGAIPALWGFGARAARLGSDLGFVPFVIGTCTVVYGLTHGVFASAASG